MPRHKELVCPSAPSQRSDSLAQTEGTPAETGTNPRAGGFAPTPWGPAELVGLLQEYLRLNEQGVPVVSGQVSRQLRALCF